jgi:hypothetical protein
VNDIKAKKANYQARRLEDTTLYATENSTDVVLNLAFTFPAYKHLKESREDLRIYLTLESATELRKQLLAAINSLKNIKR